MESAWAEMVLLRSSLRLNHPSDLGWRRSRPWCCNLEAWSPPVLGQIQVLLVVEFVSSMSMLFVKSEKTPGFLYVITIWTLERHLSSVEHFSFACMSDSFPRDTVLWDLNLCVLWANPSFRNWSHNYGSGHEAGWAGCVSSLMACTSIGQLINCWEKSNPWHFIGLNPVFNCVIE